MLVLIYAANLKRSTLFLYECDEQSNLTELETMHSDLKLGAWDTFLALFPVISNDYPS